MARTLGPTNANTFLCFHEILWLSDCPDEFKPHKYNRYVDDCSPAFKSKENTNNKYPEYLNKKYKSIYSIAEYVQNYKLPFLDIRITRGEGLLTTDVYRKYTDLSLFFDYFVPMLLMINSIKILLHRACHTCRTWQYFHEELEKIREYFYMNSYHKDLLDKHIYRFLSSKFVNSINKTIVNQIKYINLPFLGHFIYQLRNTLSNLPGHHIRDINFKSIFVNRNSRGSLFKGTDSISVPLCLNVVYCFKCPDCMSQHVGSTCHNLKIRISENKGVPDRTNTRITRPIFFKN